MRMIRWGWAPLFLVACSDGVTGLGTARTPDAGADAPAPSAAAVCNVAGVTPGIHEEADAATRVTVRSGTPVTQRMGQTLRSGRATVIGNEVLWAVADDRCGRSDLGTWWGAVVGRLSFDPDRNIVSTWTCFRDTWAALHLTPVRVGDSVGLFFARHPTLVRRTNAPDRWVPTGAGVGAADFADQRFDTTWDVNDVALAEIATDVGGFDVAFTRAGQRFYQRLDDQMRSAGDEVLLGDEQQAGRDVAMFLHPSREGYRSLWMTFPESRQDVEVTTYSRAGQPLRSWRVGQRAGLSQHVRLFATVPVEGGFVGVADTGELGASETWLARFCDDGTWSMRRFAREVMQAALVRQGTHWVALTARPLDGGAQQVIEAHVLDEDGRRMAPPREIDAGRLAEVGDLVPAPGTRDLAALYVLVPSGSSNEARAARVTVAP